MPVPSRNNFVTANPEISYSKNYKKSFTNNSSKYRATLSYVDQTGYY